MHSSCRPLLFAPNWTSLTEYARRRHQSEVNVFLLRFLGRKSTCIELTRHPPRSPAHSIAEWIIEWDLSFRISDSEKKNLNWSSCLRSLIIDSGASGLHATPRRRHTTTHFEMSAFNLMLSLGVRAGQVDQVSGSKWMMDFVVVCCLSNGRRCCGGAANAFIQNVLSYKNIIQNIFLFPTNYCHYYWRCPRATPAPVFASHLSFLCEMANR